MNDDERALLETAVHRFAERHVVPHLDELNHYPDRPLPRGLVDGLEELGLLGVDSGPAVELLVTALRTLSGTAAAPATLVFAHALARHLLAETGRQAAGLCAYPIYAEPGDTGLRYREDRDALVVDGTCQLVAGAPLARTFVLPATGEGGTMLLCVDRETRGMQIGPPLLTLGMRGCPTADVTLPRIRVELDRVAKEADALLLGAHAHFRAPAAAIAAGTLSRSRRTATEYASGRYQGGRNIIDYQEVRRLLAGMLSDEELCLSAVERLLGDTPEPAATEIFLRAKERAARATCDGVQLLGGYGYMEEYGQERCMRDAKQAQCLLGRVEVLRQDAMERWVAAGAGA